MIRKPFKAVDEFRFLVTFLDSALLEELTEIILRMVLGVPEWGEASKVILYYWCGRFEISKVGWSHIILWCGCGSIYSELIWRNAKLLANIDQSCKCGKMSAKGSRNTIEEFAKIHLEMWG